jgi:hypothetical protein
MLEINENITSQPLQHIFIPLKGIKEFSMVKEILDEN